MSASIHAMHPMSARVLKDPKAAAAELKTFFDAGSTCAVVAAKYDVTPRTLGRWVSRLREALGADGLGFVLREGRRPGSKNGRVRRDKGRKVGRSEKKKRASKKVVANSD